MNGNVATSREICTVRSLVRCLLLSCYVYGMPKVLWLLEHVCFRVDPLKDAVGSPFVKVDRQTLDSFVEKTEVLNETVPRRLSHLASRFFATTLWVDRMVDSLPMPQ